MTRDSIFREKSATPNAESAPKAGLTGGDR
jgi:hypothetical protein